MTTSFSPDHRNSVFVVHGRHVNARDQVVLFLQALSLNVISWRLAREMTDVATPTTMDVVRCGIEQSTCALIILTGDDVAQLKPHFGQEDARAQPRPNVIFEAGWALATLGPQRTILITFGNVEAMSDIEGLNLVRLDNGAESRRDLSARLADAGCTPNESGSGWLDPRQGGDFVEAVTDVAIDVELPSSQLGGLFTEYVVDSALTLELSHSKLYEDIKSAVRRNETLSLKYHYIGTRMSEYWGNVCREISYGHELLTTVTTQCVKRITEAGGLTGKTINYVSLGAGDGQADTLILDELQKHARVDWYFPVDISLDLLQLAVGSVLRADFLREGEENLKMKAILADFEESMGSLEPFFGLEDGHVLYALTGYTLGNSREDKAIEALRGVMRAGDLLLVDARLHAAPELQSDKDLTNALRAQLITPYASKAVKEFAFGPVQIASDFAVNHLDVRFDHAIHVGRETSVPQGINVFLTCKGLESNSIAISRFNLPASKGARMRRGPLRLATVTYYNPVALSAWFVNKGFSVVWSESEESIGLFLLAVADGETD